MGGGPRWLLLWEDLGPLRQGAIAFPLLGAVFFCLNLFLFNQPLWRSLLYGLIEGGLFTAVLLWVTAGERQKRRRQDDTAKGRPGS